MRHLSSLQGWGPNFALHLVMIKLHKIPLWSHCRLVSTVRNITSVDTHAFSERIKSSLITSQEKLTATNHYYLNGGKMIRPAIVLHLAECLEMSNKSSGRDDPDMLMKQHKLAEIVEMIHTASLLHDDVIDSATIRRGREAANVKFGTKSAVLSGDYMLAQASIALAELGNINVIQLLATVIKNLVEGEMLQMNSTIAEQLSISYYLQKSYLKTASLIAKSCQAVACLGSHSEEIQQACHEFGRNLGLAFQIIDDKLDFTSSTVEMGKEVGSDLRNGIFTAPILFAIDEHPRIREIIGNEFAGEHDFESVISLVKNSRAIRRTQELADNLLNKSWSAISFLPVEAITDSFVQLIASITLRNN